MASRKKELCLELVDGGIEITKKLHSLIDKWTGSKAIEDTTKGSWRDFISMYRSVTGEEPFIAGSKPPTMRDLNVLEGRIDLFENRITKHTGRIAELFLLSERVMDRNPITKRAMEKLIIAHNFHRGHRQKFVSNLNTMAVRMRDASARVGLLRIQIQEGGEMSYKKAQKKLRDIYGKYDKAVQTGDWEEAKKIWKDIDRLTKRNEYDIFKAVDEVMRDPNLLNKADVDPIHASVAQIYSDWKPMRDELHNILIDGVDRYGNVLKKVTSKNSVLLERTIRSIDKLKETLVKEPFYVPRQLLRMFPTFVKLDSEVYGGFDWDTKKVERVGNYAEEMVKAVAEDMRLSKHVHPRHDKKERQVSHSLDILGNLDAYVKNVIRFDYTSRVSDIFVDAVQKMGELKGTDLEDQSRFLTEYMWDLHQDMIGYGMKPDGKLKSFVRGVTAFEFISKLGFNFRGAARNATQSLQNWVYFGSKGLYDAHNYLSGEGMYSKVQSAMEQHGIFFQETRELAKPFADLPNIKQEGGLYTFELKKSSQKLLEHFEKAAQASGFLMQKVENKINRSLTFKIAWAKHHEALSTNAGVIRKIIEEGRVDPKEYDIKQGDTIAERVAKVIDKRSSWFAANVVREMHYEYAAFAKPKILRRGVGPIFGQFATYSINFLNYQYQIVRKAKGDVAAGKLWGEDAQRLYRLGTLYASIEYLLGPMLNTNISNLVQNDTLERMENWLDFYSGDPKQKQRAFFGKGPIVGTVGGPFVSDILTLGSVFGLAKMDQAEWVRYLTGFQDLAETTGDQKLQEIVRIANTQLARSLFYTAPRMWDGATLGTLAAMEAGLFKTKQITERKEKYIVPLASKLGIRPPKERGKRRKKREKAPTAMEEILASLETMSKMG